MNAAAFYDVKSYDRDLLSDVPGSDRLAPVFHAFRLHKGQRPDA